LRRLMDSHVHLDGLGDVEAAICRAKGAGVDGVVAVGGNLESSARSLELAELHSGYVFPAVGVHPADVLKVNLAEAVAYVDENASKAVAVGEIGLDYAYGFAKPPEVREKMRELYGGLLEVAEAHSLPVAVHSRSAYGDALSGLRVHDVPGAVFHWYDGPVHVLRDILDAGYYVSATPAARYSRGHMEVVRETPLERLLVETDSPVYMRDLGRVSEPADVWLTVEAVAGLKELEPAEVARVSTRNAETLFRLPAP
jgi:TatD DNase family protein